MLVLPQMCQVSSCLVSSAGVESECDSTRRPHHQGEEPPCRQPDTAEMKLEGDMTDTGCQTYSATTKKSCSFIYFVFEIWIKTFVKLRQGFR